MKKEVTDEQLARYMSGQSSPDEVAEVLDYLSQDDEKIEDLLNMATAVELQSKQQPKRLQLWPLWKYAVAASILLLVGIGFFMRSNLSTEQAPTYATYDTIDSDSIPTELLNYNLDEQ